MSPLRIGVIFGGRSVEHEVSVLTAQQAMAALAADRYQLVPIYISKEGRWLTGDLLRRLESFKDLDQLGRQAKVATFNVDASRPGLLLPAPVEQRGWFGGSRTTESKLAALDVVLPLLHGTHGEDGTVQGLLELADLPYVGCDVTASAIAMDKVLTKTVLRAAGLPVLDELAVSRRRWEREPAAVVAEVEGRFGYPVFVKPVSLGSSIAVNRAATAAELQQALTVAATYDRRLMVEPAAAEVIEINCAVLGDGELARPSICEQPMTVGMLSYADKYLSGDKHQGMKSAKRLIPAPIPATLTEAIQQTALRAFAAIGAAGVARIDFLVQPASGTIFVNEINPIPGSLAFYLWEPTGLSFPALLDELVELAQARHQDKRRTTYSFGSSLLSGQIGSKVGPAR